MSIEAEAMAELTEDLAQNIKRIAEGMQALNKSRVRRRALLLLINDVTGVSKTNIGKVLDAAERLDEIFLKPVKKGIKR